MTASDFRDTSRGKAPNSQTNQVVHLVSYHIKCVCGFELIELVTWFVQQQNYDNGDIFKTSLFTLVSGTDFDPEQKTLTLPLSSLQSN